MKIIIFLIMTFSILIMPLLSNPLTDNNRFITSTGIQVKIPDGWKFSSKCETAPIVKKDRKIDKVTNLSCLKQFSGKLSYSDKAGKIQRRNAWAIIREIPNPKDLLNHMKKKLANHVDLDRDSQVIDSAFLTNIGNLEAAQTGYSVIFKEKKGEFQDVIYEVWVFKFKDIFYELEVGAKGPPDEKELVSKLTEVKNWLDFQSHNL